MLVDMPEVSTSEELEFLEVIGDTPDFIFDIF